MKVAKMIEVIDFLNTGGSFASFAGFFLSIRQWLASTSADQSRQTVEHYLEWLRREDHAELATAIRGNSDALDSIGEIIGNLRTTILEAITAHERASQARHEQIVSGLSPAPPKLQISFKQPFRSDWEQRYSRAFAATFQVINMGGQIATFEHCAARLRYADGTLLRALLVRLPDGLLNLPAHGGAETVQLWTPAAAGKENEMPTFEYIEIKLAQENDSRRFALGEGKLLVEIAISSD